MEVASKGPVSCRRAQDSTFNCIGIGFSLFLQDQTDMRNPIGLGSLLFETFEARHIFPLTGPTPTNIHIRLGLRAEPVICFSPSN